MIESDFWISNESLVLLNPRYPEKEQQLLSDAAREVATESAVWLRSSGTESARQGIKLVCLTKKAILVGAESFNKTYHLSKADRWLNPLPSFHIGGLAVGARCFLAGCPEIKFQNWQVDSFVETLAEEKITITSLVPTQIYDLVVAQKQAPLSLRFILVGGGSLSEDLYFKARQLGWPLIPSYGMTETSAIIAGAPLSSLDSQNFPSMETLPHVNLKFIDEKAVLESECLFEGYLWVESTGESQWQVRPRPFILDDRLELNGKSLKVMGRESEFVKILGESVNLHQLNQKLSTMINRPLIVLPEKEPRRGFNLHMFYEGAEQALDLDAINQKLMPYERICKSYPISSLPRTTIGKVDRAFLYTLIK